MPSWKRFDWKLLGETLMFLMAIALMLAGVALLGATIIVVGTGLGG